jgi:phosphoglucomutase
MASRAGTVAQPQDLVDITALLDAYYDITPDLGDPGQRVVFGTSGHRGSSLKASFNEKHIVAITQAIVEYRAAQGVTGPLFLAKDTHALSEPAQNSALEVLAANGVQVLIDARHGYTPTPALSHAILTYNRNAGTGAPQADGIVVTPSHNPPGDGGFKYNPPHGGPADSDATGWIANRANELLENGLRGVKRIPVAEALAADTTGKFDFLSSYVDDLPSVLDLDAIREAGVRIGADPMGGASVDYWGEIAERHQLNLTVVNPTVDPQWAFMTLDWDEKIRMDCSSPAAMASLIQRMSDGGAGAGASFDVATGNDADADRHGIVTPDGGLMNPNHYLAVAIDYLYRNRSGWNPAPWWARRWCPPPSLTAWPKAWAASWWRSPWASSGLFRGCSPARARSAARSRPAPRSTKRTAASGPRTRTASCWPCSPRRSLRSRASPRPSSTRASRTSSVHPVYARIDAAATREQKAALGKLSPSDVTATELAGETITRQAH